MPVRKCREQRRELRGNGGWMPGPYVNFEVDALVPGEVQPAVREAFPITRERLREGLAAPGSMMFPELEVIWKQVRRGQVPGKLGLGQYPGGDGVFLVVTGELRGMVWCDANYGIPEMQNDGEPHDFLSWFEYVLLDARGWYS